MKKNNVKRVPTKKVWELLAKAVGKGTGGCS